MFRVMNTGQKAITFELNAVKSGLRPWMAFLAIYSFPGIRLWPGIQYKSRYFPAAPNLLPPCL